MKTIKVYTNLVMYGWSARQLESGIGGSEEKLIEWAREMAKDYDVTIYMNGEHGDFDGVHYRDHREFNAWESCDIFISFKNKEILKDSINAEQIYHWTTEIEPVWATFLKDNVKNIITLSKYHTSRMGDSDDAKVKHIYLWADIEKLNKNIVVKEKDTMLYSSSYDRGLEELLINWEKIKELMGVKKLYLTYGWEFLDQVIKHNPNMKIWKDRMTQLLSQEGIEMLGRVSNDKMSELYWKAEYWCLPLNNPDSELFCINAVKAQYCGSKPVVIRAGALQETVNHFISWKDLILKGEFKDLTDKQVLENKKHALNFEMSRQINNWKKLFNSTH